MQISSVKPINTPSFSAINIPDRRAQILISKSLKNSQWEKLKEIAEEQRTNPVHVFIYSKNGYSLQARIYCQYRLRDFQEYYKQIPLLESKFGFIKRVVNKLNEYKEQLTDFI